MFVADARTTLEGKELNYQSVLWFLIDLQNGLALSKENMTDLEEVQRKVKQYLTKLLWKETQEGGIVFLKIVMYKRTQ